MKKTKGKWELIPWDGNPALNLMCWRKQFGRGHVSVGCGEFLNIVYSYGDNSEKSYSGTRWRPLGDHITEQEAMELVDKHNGESTGDSYKRYIEANNLQDWDPYKHGDAREWRAWVAAGSEPFYGYHLGTSGRVSGEDTLGVDTGYRTAEHALVAGNIARERWLQQNDRDTRVRGKVLKNGFVHQFFGDHT